MLADTAKSLTAGAEVTIALSTSGAGEGIIGFEGAAGGGVRRTTTRLLDGEFPKVRTLFPSRARRPWRGSTGPPWSRRSSGSRWSPSATPRSSSRSPTAVLTLDAGSGDEALATEQIDAEVKGDDITTGFNPQFLLDGLTAIESPVVELAFTQASKPAVIAGVDSLDGEADTDVPLPADAAPAALLSVPSGTSGWA